MQTNLKSRTVVITGASSGIGAATAIACAEAGMHVVLGARRVDRLEEVAAQVRDLGRNAHVVPGDVTDPGNIEALLDATDDVHAVFANAGYGMRRRTTNEAPDVHRAMFDVNYFASVDLARTAAQRWLDAGRGGHILMCSSCLSKFSLPQHGAYSATKAAQNAVCQAMRLEMAGSGIYVSSVHPITTTTEFTFASAERDGRPAPASNRPAHAPGLFVQSPERVARAVVRCLKRPRPEVWTSHIVRIVAGVSTVFPRFGDYVIQRQARKDD